MPRSHLQSTFLSHPSRLLPTPQAYDAHFDASMDNVDEDEDEEEARLDIALLGQGLARKEQRLDPARLLAKTGDVLRDLGRLDEALKYSQHALSMAPQHVGARATRTATRTAAARRSSPLGSRHARGRGPHLLHDASPAATTSYSLSNARYEQCTP